MIRLIVHQYKSLALLILMVFHLGPVGAASLPDTIDLIRPSIVGVGTLMPIRRPSAKFFGTGFVVGKGNLVVTNHHVLPDTMNTSKREALAVFSGRGKQAKAHKVRILRADPEHDLVLLELIEGRLPPMKLSGQAKVREGESVAFTGFPIGMVLGLYPITHRAIISAITPVV
ncbi:MAG: trypsin-like peptidase domain-containing protein, partial [Gammaproteobacteria bacterium]|nr:trypsin-like peptidase domain-containing protein [Gammaproteobacteria bacterium]